MRGALLLPMMASSLLRGVSGFAGVENRGARANRVNLASGDPSLHSRTLQSRMFAAEENSNADEIDESEDEAAENQIEFASDAVVKIDDGGSDLTNRFKYKESFLREDCAIFDVMTRAHSNPVPYIHFITKTGERTHGRV